MEKQKTKRVNINLPTTLQLRVKQYANKLGVNYTSAYIILLNMALTAVGIGNE